MRGIQNMTAMLALQGKARCNHCKKIKDTTKFYRDKSRKSGRAGICIECEKERAKTPRQLACKLRCALAWNALHKDHIRIYHKHHWKLKKRKGKSV